VIDTTPQFIDASREALANPVSDMVKGSLARNCSQGSSTKCSQRAECTADKPSANGSGKACPGPTECVSYSIDLLSSTGVRSQDPKTLISSVRERNRQSGSPKQNSTRSNSERRHTSMTKPTWY